MKVDVKELLGMRNVCAHTQEIHPHTHALQRRNGETFFVFAPASRAHDYEYLARVFFREYVEMGDYGMPFVLSHIHLDPHTHVFAQHDTQDTTMVRYILCNEQNDYRDPSADFPF